jgi:rubrerythrin
MSILRALRTLGLKSILSAALALEREIFDLYSSLKTGPAGGEIPPSLARILDEEAGHQHLIRDVIDGRIEELELEATIAARDLDVHRPGEIEALSADRYGPLLERLETILEKEKEIHSLFAGLHRKAKIPFVRRAFRFLEEQERIHIRVLERLLGREEA